MIIHYLNDEKMLSKHLGVIVNPFFFRSLGVTTHNKHNWYA